MAGSSSWGGWKELDNGSEQWAGLTCQEGTPDIQNSEALKSAEVNCYALISKTFNHL